MSTHKYEPSDVLSLAPPASMAKVRQGLRQWCRVCARATASKTCDTCGAEVCAECGDHGAARACGCHDDDD